MTTINLKNYYLWYKHDEYIEVPDEVAAELKVDKLYEVSYQRQLILVLILERSLGTFT